MSSVEELIYTPTSDQDLKKWLPANVPVLAYSDLEGQTIETLLPSKGGFVLHVPTHGDPSRGHWIAVTRNGKRVTVFDPYGDRPDKRLRWIPRHLRKRAGTDEPHLSDMLNDWVKRGNEVTFNRHEYQKRRSDSQTCGRHVAAYLNWFHQNQNTELQNYFQKMRQTMKAHGHTADEIVTLMYS